MLKYYNRHFSPYFIQRLRAIIDISSVEECHVINRLIDMGLQPLDTSQEYCAFSISGNELTYCDRLQAAKPDGSNISDIRSGELALFETSIVYVHSFSGNFAKCYFFKGLDSLYDLSGIMYNMITYSSLESLSYDTKACWISNLRRSTPLSKSKSKIKEFCDVPDTVWESIMHKLHTYDEEEEMVFEMVSGSKIHDYYLEEEFSDKIIGSSTLAMSCMRNVDQHYLYFYGDNPEVCKLAVMSDSNGVVARAICWLTQVGWSYGKIISGGNYYATMLKGYMSEQGIEAIGEHAHYVKIANGDYSYYPYVDVMQFLYYIQGQWILCNKSTAINALYGADVSNRVTPLILEECDVQHYYGRNHCICSIDMTYYPQEDCSRINGKHYHNRHVVTTGNSKMLRATSTKSRYGCYYNDDNKILFNGIFVNKDHIVTDFYGNKQHDSQCVVTAQGMVHKNDINLIYSHVTSKWLLKQYAEQTIYGWLPKAKVSLEMDIMFQTV